MPLLASKINIVDDMDKLVNPGDVMPYENKELNCIQLAICCPQCGQLSGSGGTHKWNATTLTYTPSVICPCGAHYNIVNGLIK